MKIKLRPGYEKERAVQVQVKKSPSSVEMWWCVRLLVLISFRLDCRGDPESRKKRTLYYVPEEKGFTSKQNTLS